MSNFSPKVKRVGKGTEEELKLAVALAKEKRFDEALWGFKTILQSEPTSKAAHLGAGNMLFKQERYDEALIHFQEVMRLDPLMPKAPLVAGKIYLKQGNLEKAFEVFQDAINLAPTSPQAYIGIGQVLVKQEKYDEAIEQLHKAVRLDPQLITVRLLVAQLHQKQKNLAKAISELKSALNIDPTKWFIYQAMGRIYLQQKEFSSAREAFQEALKFNPQVPYPAQLGLVEALIGENQLDEAIEILRPLPRLKSLEPNKHKLWGDIYQRQGLLKEATQEYRAAAMLGAEQGDTLGELAELDVLFEQNNDRWQEVLEPFRAAATQRVSEVQSSRRANDRRERRSRAR
jgi:tetratricopeptide (TPR) repeat protein